MAPRTSFLCPAWEGLPQEKNSDDDSDDDENNDHDDAEKQKKRCENNWGTKMT